MLNRNNTFTNTRIELDNQTFEDCSFNGCTVTFSGKGPYKLSGCTFNNCQFALDGSAALTVKYLTDMHRMNAPFVLDVIKKIRTGQE
jgi:hypothetical protein